MVWPSVRHAIADELPNRERPIWVYPKKDESLQRRIVKEFMIHPAIAQLLITRNFVDLDSIHNFLYGQLPSLYPPELLSGMDRAVTRVLDALHHKQRVLIFGDNDVDGLTATALLVEFLTRLGLEVHYVISSKILLSDKPMRKAHADAKRKKCQLIITVDCGVTAAQEVNEIVCDGIDVIVTDHHEPTSTLPHCIATLNPKLVQSVYPNRELTGVAVAFKLAHGIVNRMVNDGDARIKGIDLRAYLDFVALGTIADMGALLGENRILVRYGIKQLQRNPRIGLKALFDIARVTPARCTSFDIASKLTPRINSLARVGDANLGMRLLLTKDVEEAKQLAEKLDATNTHRQSIERVMANDLEERLARSRTIVQEPVIFMSSDKWHPGVIPLLANRLTKQHNRPSVVISCDKELAKGSLRSIKPFPLLSSLKECRDLLNNFGGHNYAAGLVMPTKNIELFRERFLAIASNSLALDDMRSFLQLDSSIHFDDLDFEFLSSMELLEPYGYENPLPLFYCHIEQVWPPKALQKSHLKLYLQQGDRVLEGIALSASGRRQEIKGYSHFDIAFTPQLNTQKNSVQLFIKDLLY